MRSILVLVLLLLSSSLAPSGLAEPVADAAGDVAASARGPATVPVPTPVPGALADSVDLIAFEVEETLETLVFHLDVVKLDTNSIFTRYEVAFSWNGTDYVASMFPFPFRILFGQAPSIGLFQVDASGARERVADLEGSFGDQPNRVSISVPRVFILDGQDRIPQKGSTLEAVQGRSLSWVQLTVDGDGLAGFLITDFAPDVPAPYELITGDLSEGHLRLVSDETIRVSNGGATTFVYRFTLLNADGAADEVRLAPLDLPEGWRVRVESPVRVDAGGFLELVALVSVPFGHEHGGFTSFTLEAVSTGDASAFSRLRLGVLHTSIPQPAGHHPDLYLHGVPVDDFQFPLIGVEGVAMNTVADHEGDPEMLPPNDYEDAGVWVIDLSPALRMGLDFDLDGIGRLEGSIQTPDNAGGDLRAELSLVEDDGETLLASSTPIHIVGSAQTPVPFGLDFALEPAADYVPYADGLGLRLRVYFETETSFLCCFGPTSPQLLTSAFKLSLPLLEYHDRLAPQPGMVGLGGLELRAESLVEKSVKPGAMATYPFVMKNTGSEAATFILAIAGSDADRGVLTPGGPVMLDAGEERRLTLGVRVPSDASDGQAYEVLIFARAKDDPSVSAIGRTMTHVGWGEEVIADESAVFAAAETDAKKTPGVALPLMLVALVALALSTRRRK